MTVEMRFVIGKRTSTKLAFLPAASHLNNNNKKSYKFILSVNSNKHLRFCGVIESYKLATAIRQIYFVSPEDQFPCDQGLLHTEHNIHLIYIIIIETV